MGVPCRWVSLSFVPEPLSAAGRGLTKGGIGRPDRGISCTTGGCVLPGHAVSDRRRGAERRSREA